MNISQNDTKEKGLSEVRIARIFPRKTTMTPTDELVFFDKPPKALPEIDEVHVSVAFTWDIPKAETLADQWRSSGVPVRVGGPAYGLPGNGFTPGLYVKEGAVITSRGCPNHCWFCSVPKREGMLRELSIPEGWNVLDDNLLACSDDHVRKVFQMLSRQKHKPVFSGGLEAKIMKPWHVAELRKLHPQRLYCAYDTPDDFGPLVDAGEMMQKAGFTFASHVMCAYVLIGYPGDTFLEANKRLYGTIIAGFMPYAMLWRNDKGEMDPEWRRFQREWVRPEIVATKAKRIRAERRANDA